jgi:hypothetical protein
MAISGLMDAGDKSAVEFETKPSPKFGAVELSSCCTHTGRQSIHVVTVSRRKPAHIAWFTEGEGPSNDHAVFTLLAKKTLEPPLSRCCSVSW